MTTEPASPEQQLLYGPLAARLRAFIDDRGWSPSDLREALDMSANNPVVYVWLNAKGAPGAKYRAQLSKLTGIAEKYLMPSDEVSQELPPVPEKRSYLRQAANPLEFIIGPDSMATIKLNATLPVGEAMMVLKTLMDYPFLRPEL